MREKILKAIHKNSKLSAEDLSKMLGASEEEVKAVIKEMEEALGDTADILLTKGQNHGAVIYP